MADGALLLPQLSGLPAPALARGGSSGSGGAPAPGFDILSLFAAGEVGILHGLEAGTLFSDEAGTVEAAVGEPVAFMADASGNGLHAVQATPSARPVLRVDETGRRHLELNGSSTFYQSPISGIGLGGISAAMAAGYMRTGGSGYVLNAAGSQSASADRSFNVLLLSTGNVAEFMVGGAPAGQNNSTLAGMNRGCVAAAWDRVAGTGTIRWNDGEPAALGIGAVSQDEPLQIGRRIGGAYLQGRIYGIVARLAPTSAAQLAGMSAWAAAKAGL